VLSHTAASPADEMGMYRQHLQLKLGEYGVDPERYRKRP